MWRCLVLTGLDAGSSETVALHCALKSKAVVLLLRQISYRTTLSFSLLNVIEASRSKPKKGINLETQSCVFTASGPAVIGLVRSAPVEVWATCKGEELAFFQSLADLCLSPLRLPSDAPDKVDKITAHLSVSSPR